MDVCIVDDQALPEGHDLVIIERDGQQPVMLLSGRPAAAWLAMRAYEETMQPADAPSLLYAV